MNKKRLSISLIDFVILWYLILPIFFRIGPASVYHYLLIGAFIFVSLWKGLTFSRTGALPLGWNVRATLILFAMIMHGEYTSIIVYMVTPILLFCFLFSNIKTYQQIDKIIDVIIVASVINVFVCIIEEFTSVNLSYWLCTDDSVSYFSIYRGGILRVAGLFVNAINNGLFCVFVLGLIMYRIYQKQNPTQHIKRYWVIWSLNMLVIFLTYSRAAILAAVVVTIFMLSIAGALKLTRRRMLIALLLLVVTVAVIFIPNPIQNSVTNIAISVLKVIDGILGTTFVGAMAENTDVDGIGNRLELFQWVLNELKGNYVFGVGKNVRFAYAVNQWFTKTSIENTYLLEFYRYGIIGLSSKIILFLSTLWLAAKNAFFKRTNTFFHKMIFLEFSIYFLSLFTVAQNEEKKVFNLLVALEAIACGIDKMKRKRIDETLENHSLRTNIAIKQ